MTPLQIRLFGPFEVTVDRAPVSGFDSDKVRALLAYLVVEADRPHRREKLAGLLWPDYPDSSARTNLRRALSNLRTVIGDRDAAPPYLLISRQTIQFNVASKAAVDVLRFLDLYQGDQEQSPATADLAEAVELARGPFLEGFSLSDSPPFEEWLRVTGESLQQKWLRGLQQLADRTADQGQVAAALDYAQRLVAHDPFREETHRQVMQLLVQAGQRGAALAHYETLKAILETELQVAPSPETEALYASIQSGKAAASPRSSPTDMVRGYELLEQLGQGHFGTVYRAHQQVVGRDVAIKIILPHYANNPDFIRRFEVEAQLVARLEHPHIVPLYDYWREPQGAYLVMRFMRGGSLFENLKEGPWELERAGRLLDQLSGALATAHYQGVVHRDIKPQNIMMDEMGNVFLADFGIAKDLVRDKPMTAEGTILGTLDYASPEQILSEEVTPQTDIYSLGIVLYELLTGHKPFGDSSIAKLLHSHLYEPVPLVAAVRADIPQKLDVVLQKATAKNPQERYADVHELADAFQAATALPALNRPVVVPAAVVTNPYKGLRPFREADAADFFGRTALVERLLDRVATEDTESRFLALVGPSGSGKSSVINAGLLPALRQGALPGSADWFIAHMVPGRYPLDELEIALLRIAASQPAGLMAQLHRDERGLIRAAQLILPDEAGELLLVIDQFEEIFTQAADEQETGRFLQLLATAATSPRSPVRVLVSLRADFYDRPLLHAAFGRLMRAHTEVVIPMDVTEMSQAITAPAARVGVQPEPELMARMIADTSAQPGALPLVQYALTEMFDRREGPLLTLAAYQEMGGVLGALSRRAEGIFQELDAPQQEATRQLFLRLVNLGEGTEDTRRRLLLAELEAIQPAGAAGGSTPLEKVLDAFGRYRLLTFDRDPATRRPTVEIAHEALIREWNRLRQWLDESRADLRQEWAVAQAAEVWQAHDREESFLLRGARLAQVEAWFAASTLAHTPLVEAYIDHSLDQQGREQEAEAERLRHERHLERRSRIFLRSLVAVFALATVISVVLLFLALDQRQAARANAAAAQNVAIVAGSQAALANNDTDTALALAWQAATLYPDSALAQAQLSAAAYAPGTVRIFEGNAISANRAMFSPDGQYVFAGVDDGSVFLWEAATGRLVWQHQADPREVNDAAFSPDGRLVAATFDDRILFWQTADGALFREVTSTALDQKIAFHPAGAEFATIGKEDEGLLVFWDLETGARLREYARGANIEEFLFTADGSQILLASQNGELTLLDAETAEVIYAVPQDAIDDSSTLRMIALSPDGTQLAGSFSSAGLLVWNVADGEVLRDIRFPGGITSVAFHPRNGNIFSDGQGFQATNPNTGEILWVNNAESAAILDISITQDGRYAVTSALNGTIRLWDLEYGQVERRYAQPSALLFEAAVSPDGRLVLGGTYDGKVTLWNLETGAVIHEFVNDQPIMAVTFSPDGRQALIGAGYRIAEKVESGAIILWDVETGAEIRRLEGQPYVVFDVEFSPDGKQAVSVGNGAMAILWDLETGAEIRRFDDYWVDGPWPNESFWSASFSPDGRQIYAAHSSGVIANWDIENGQEIRQLAGHELGTAAIVFDQPGEQFVTGGVDSQVILWDVASGNILRRLTDHSGGVGEIRFSPDDTLLIGGGSDGFSSLWRVDTGEVIRRYGGGYIFSPSFTPDGQQAVVGYQDGRIELWRIDATLEALRNWTENNRYIPELSCAQRDLYDVEPLCDPESS